VDGENPITEEAGEGCNTNKAKEMNNTKKKKTLTLILRSKH
jgi:hypothetical protein